MYTTGDIRDVSLTQPCVTVTVRLCQVTQSDYRFHNFNRKRHGKSSADIHHSPMRFDEHKISSDYLSFESAKTRNCSES